MLTSSAVAQAPGSKEMRVIENSTQDELDMQRLGKQQQLKVGAINTILYASISVIRALL
jgi:hypothetical protein